MELNDERIQELLRIANAAIKAFFLSDSKREVHDAMQALAAALPVMATVSTKISPVDAAKKMAKIFPPEGYDKEGAHSDADNLLCEILIGFGYQEAVDMFKIAEKWYA